MTNEITFSDEIPKEAGVYPWRVIGSKSVRFSILYEGESWQHLNGKQEFGPKLIPSTALEDAQKRIGELESQIEKMEKTIEGFS